MADERIEALRNDPEWSAAAKVIYDKGGIAHADREAYLESVADRAATTDDRAAEVEARVERAARAMCAVTEKRMALRMWEDDGAKEHYRQLARAALDSLPPSLKGATEEGEGGE